MRKSQAPSFRSTGKLPVTNKKQEDDRSSFPPLKRGDDAILNLLLGESEEGKQVEAGNDENVVAEESRSKQPCDSTCNSVPNGEIVYNVVYGKQSKRKHKVWEGDGTLEVGTKVLTLRDDKGKVIGTTSNSKSKVIEEGSHVYVGSKEVEVIELIKRNIEEIEDQPSPVKQVVKKRKLNISGKRFVPPLLSVLDKSKTTFILPEPSAEHQWHFNKNDLPITEVWVDGNLSRNLRQHQCVGITFLYECIMGYKLNDISGAILADEMGLGKTLQTIVLIWTLLKQGPYGNKPVLKKVLIVTPSSLTMNWHNEFVKWLGRGRMVPYVIDSKNKPQDMKGPVMIISYEMFVRYYDEIKDFAFDLLVCDEGHRLKNSNIRTTQLLRSLNCPKRILLTGTPIQNDLKEFYTLVDFVNPNILGSPADFRRSFEEPILASRQPFADEETIARGEECAGELNRKTSLFVLRRSKEVLEDYLPAKNEIVVFCRVGTVQRDMYNHLINNLIDNKEKILGDSDCFFHLGLLTSLRKVCNHPALFWANDPDDSREDMLITKSDVSFSNVKHNFEPELSAKLTVVLNFLSELKENFEKERVVLISNSTKTLDLLEKHINESGYSSCRLDGSTPGAQRVGMVERFNQSHSSIFVFLLSSKAGGVGLNLTGASRLILYDSDWNPATDLQAMSRIWRDGQKTSVYIYRLLTCGTIEEKIYQRQMDKQGLYEGVVDAQSARSIRLSREEVKDVFAYCEIRDGCSTHDMLSCQCSKNGEIPAAEGVEEEEEEEEERSCQLMKQSKPGLRMNELFHWEHHGPPFRSSLLSELCLSSSEQAISFIFRSRKSMEKVLSSSPDTFHAFPNLKCRKSNSVPSTLKRYGGVYVKKLGYFLDEPKKWKIASSAVDLGNNLERPQDQVQRFSIVFGDPVGISVFLYSLERSLPRAPGRNNRREVDIDLSVFSQV